MKTGLAARSLLAFGGSVAVIGSAAGATVPGTYYSVSTGPSMNEQLVSSVAGVSVIDETQSVDRSFVAGPTGVYQVRWNGSTFVSEMVSPTVANVLADITNLEDRLWAGGSTGQHEVFYSFGTNSWHDDLNSTAVFQRMVDPSDTIDRLWGVSSGDVYEVRWFGSSWQSVLRRSGAYTDIEQVNAGGSPERFWIASPSGIEYLYPDLHVDSVVSLSGIRDLATDPSRERVWAATDSGLYEVLWNGSSWVANLKSTEVFDKIEATAFLFGSDYRVWGLNGNGVYEVFNGGGALWNADLRIASPYTDFALADQQPGRDPVVWGVIANVPEPTISSVSALAASALCRRQRGRSN